MKRSIDQTIDKLSAKMVQQQQLHQNISSTINANFEYNSTKKIKIDNEPFHGLDSSKNGVFSCEICHSSFVSAFDLRQHVEAAHMKTSMWMCSDCKKVIVQVFKNQTIFKGKILKFIFYLKSYSPVNPTLKFIYVFTPA
jgi:hypothetical protein